MSDVDLQSKAGQLKLAPNAKAAQILTYKQQHIQYQQQQASHSNRKVNISIYIWLRILNWKKNSFMRDLDVDQFNA